MTMTTSHIWHLPKAILYCLLTIPCHSAGDLQLNIKAYRKDPYTIHVSATGTIADLKQKILAQKGIKVEKQRLIYAGKELEDDKTISYYHIQNDATVHIVIKMLRLFYIDVKVNNGQIVSNIPVYENTTIQHIKEEINRLTSYEVSAQKLYKDDKDDTELDNKQLYNDARIKDGTILHLTLTPKDTSDPTKKYIGGFVALLVILGILYYFLFPSTQDETPQKTNQATPSRRKHTPQKSTQATPSPQERTPQAA